MALTSQDMSRLNSAQQAALQSYTNDWNAANARGDQAGMDAAHAAAEAIRGSAGYYGNADGTYSGELVSNTAGSLVPGFQQLLEESKASVDRNNAIAHANAQAQWNFNREEAQKNRDWQEYMSNTAHQREVRDLIAAGLNPVLSAGGSGAAVTSGATASGTSAGNDTSGTSIFGNFLNSLISSATAINAANINAKSAYNVAKTYTAMDYAIHRDFPGSLGALISNGLVGIGQGAGLSSREVGEKGLQAFVDVVNGLISKGVIELPKKQPTWKEQVEKAKPGDWPTD